MSVWGLLAAALTPSSAQTYQRYAHTATVLPDGNTLVLGGAQAPDVILSTTTLVFGDADAAVDLAAAPVPATLGVGRASHTATVLPTGEVFVAGGVTRVGAGALAVEPTAAIYNPLARCWRPTISMAAAGPRFNHTATLLVSPAARAGQVLLCGGNNAIAGPDSTLNTCVLFTPDLTVNRANCAADGSAGFGAAILLQARRAGHTASLLADGRVFLAGGTNDGTGVNASDDYVLVTTEIFEPATALTGPAAPLIERRVYHRATVMGDGRVMITGGYNGRDTRGNRGFLETTEIYDPIANTMKPGVPMNARVSRHGAVLRSDGEVSIFGGLGNITTTFVKIDAPLLPGSTVYGCFDSAGICAGVQPTPPQLLSTMTIRAGSALLTLDITLAVPVSGVIQDGVVLISSPQIAFQTGKALLTPGFIGPNDSDGGTAIVLDGVPVTCLDGVCGRIVTNVSIPLMGQYFQTTQFVSSTQGILILAAGSRIDFPGFVNSQTGPTSATMNYASTFKGSVKFTGLPRELIGATVSSGVIHIQSAGPVTTVDIPTGDQLISASLTNGWATIPAVTLTEGADGNAVMNFSISISSVEGTVFASTPSNQFSQSAVGFALGNINGTANMVTDFVNLDGASFQTDITTVVIRRMVFQDNELYSPKTGLQWNFNFNASGTGLERYDPTVTLLPTSDQLIIGGRSCDPNSLRCSRELNRGRLAVVERILSTWGAGSSLGSKRRAHTATLLPNGQILVAGGSSGNSVLPTAELYDPVNDSFSPTGSMADARDLHTATLLPNGHVLVTGGFSTNAISSAPTRSAELYFPETGTWTKLPDMPYPADNHTAVLLANGNVLVAGGFSGQIHLSSAAIFISTSNTWESAPSMSMARPRALHTATLLQDGRVFAFGGVNGTGVLNRGEIFNPVTRTWSEAAVPPAPTAVRSHASTLLNDGRVLVSGGDNGFGETRTTMVYDPMLGVWIDLTLPPFSAPLAAGRFNHTAVLLPNGTVMAIGGSQALGGTIKTAETFKIALSTWALSASLNTGRTLHTTTLGRDGILYTIGGFDSTVADSLDDSERLYFLGSKDGETVGALPNSPRISSITSIDLSPFGAGDSITLRGNRLLGIGEASGGGAAGGNSDHHSPRIRLQALDGSSGGGSQGQGGFIIDLSTRFHQQTGTFFTRASSSMTLQLTNLTGLGERTLPFGWYHLRVHQNALFSDSLLVQAGPKKPTAGITNLTADGPTISSNTIRWTWTAAAGVYDGYNVYAASSGVLIATRPAAAVDFFQRGLPANATAAIVVAPFTLSGDGPLAFSATFYTLSTAPVNVSISSVGFDSLQLSWNANGNEPGTVYEISTSTDAFQTGISISTPVPALLGLTTDHFLLTNLQYNTTYHMRVRAFNGAGLSSDFSAVVSTRTGAPVQSLSGAALSPTSIQWNWVHPGGSVNQFKIYNATTGAVVATTATSTFVDINLATNTARVLLVSAMTSAGEGPLSASATVYTLAAAPVPQVPAIINLSTGSLTALWSANGNPLGTLYGVELAVADSTTSVEVNTQNFQAGFSNISPAGTPVTVTVHAHNKSDFATDRTLLGSLSTLARAPQDVNALDRKATSISINWDINGNGPLVVYEVTYTTNGFATVNTARSFAANSNSSTETISGLATSATYEFRVQARNQEGIASAFSASFTTNTYNGGAPTFQLRAPIPANTTVEVNGTIGENFRYVSLRVPAGAFSEDVTVTLSSITVPPSPCGAFGTSAGINIDVSPPRQPQKPVLLTVAYTDAEMAGIKLNQAALNRVDASGNCVPLVSFLDAPNRHITAQLNHFSLFQVAQVAPANTVDTTYIFPNPYYGARGDGYITLSRMPARARIRIFTLRGEPVYSGEANDSGLFVWNAVNSYGRSVASGVYLVVVENGGSKSIKKLVVLR